MGIFAIILIVLAILASTGQFGSHVAFNGFSNFNPSEAKVKADFRSIQKDLKEKSDALIPFPSDEYKILAYTLADLKVSKGNVTRATATFNTIYQEPVAYAQSKKYISKQENSILVIRAHSAEILYRTKKNSTEIAYNGNYLGSLAANGMLTENNKLIGRLDRQSNAQTTSVYWGKTEVARLNTAKNVKQVNPRAFELVYPEKTPPQALALVFWEQFSHQVSTKTTKKKGK